MIVSGIRFLRACATNQIARFAPTMYFRLVGDTGRGDGGGESAQDVATYFASCFADYFRVLDIAPSAIGGWLRGKTLLEYGPGDLPAVALLMVAHGAEKVFCVDRFPLLTLGSKNLLAIERLLALLPPEALARAHTCFRTPGRPESGFDPARIEYLVNANGLCARDGVADMVFSRAVLEHVNDLPGTFVDMERALKPGGLAIHQVDLKSHGLHLSNPLDFLCWPPWMWSLMFSHKGAPNRWRITHYRSALARTKLKLRKLERIEYAEERQVNAVRSDLAPPFRDLTVEELSWLSFWLVCEKLPLHAPASGDAEVSLLTHE